MLPPQSQLRLILLTVVTLAVGLAAITHQSFWMDEGGTAFKALMPTLGDWWTMMQQLGISDMQMPGYLLLTWAWHHMGAVSEYALRAGNLPWLVITVLALSRVRWWALVCLTSPFVLYYVGELRPYALQIAAGTLAASALGKLIEARDRQDFHGLHAWCGACLLLAASSLTGAVWAAGVATGGLILRSDWLTKRGFWLRALPWLAAATAAASYYAYTLLKGYRAAAFGDAGILNVLFGFYEMAGLLGAGPGRDELRAGPAALIPYLWIVLPAALCVAGAWLVGIRSWIKTVPVRCVIGVACAAALPVIVLTVVGSLQDFRVLGRHMSPLVPAVLLPISAAFAAPGRLRLPGAILGTLAVGSMVVSSVSLRFHERHARDDYRRATEIALKSLQEGKEVWWQADMNATRYYAYRKGGMPLINAVQLLESKPPASLMFADIVVINRPDIRYGKSDYRKELHRNFFELAETFTGFEVWKSR
jgi:hypothetical protein